ncbi:Fungalysin metallopeptidase-domain-containing protein [Polychytrium aggregatum]|uniref:Fungalysin metallopeptidase-domain-containing protein n=1 Tax=Polychytrium aggregatum TaxID=110093 RepID=UPI0022FE0992|nr:Fungalysin metallopeptidase-domain-containing protein [Polychytrium aggregatum]KAI9193075.1 Fungalysin metallopeptidase-domain-containing protein [Polychytrium aggregatum]
MVLIRRRNLLQGVALAGLLSSAAAKALGSLPDSYWPSPSFEVSDVVSNLVDQPLDLGALQSTAVDILTKKLGVSQSQFAITTSFQDDHNGIYHLHVQQLIGGQPIANAVANINLDSNGNLLSIGSTFAKVDSSLTKRGLEPRAAKISAKKALTNFLTKAKIKFTASKLKETVKDNTTSVIDGAQDFAQLPITASLQYYQGPSGVSQVWNINVYTKGGDDWFDAFVDSQTGEVVAVANWVNKFSQAGPSTTYNVIPFNYGDISQTPQTPVANPADQDISPLGWHDDGSGANPTTKGNNVHAQENWKNYPKGQDEAQGTRPTVGSDYNFNFKYDTTQDPKSNVNAAITQLFYMNNMAHDIFYRYGFNEASGNFQTNNFGKGRPGRRLSNFATPPDGQNGRMRMYIFTATTPNRDGTMDNMIITHEFGHGVSNRLTGGSAQANCLSTTTAGGLGEGWSDFFANIFELKPTYNRNTPIYAAPYTVGNPKGIRHYPYTSDMTLNPETYATVAKSSEVHNVGEIWTQMLMEVAWNLIEKYGFEPDIQNSKSGKGNNIALQLVIDGLKLQPCNPDFVSARNAIIQADQQNNNGANLCEIWTGFAKRGLGYSAKAGSYVDAKDLPPACAGPKSSSTTSAPKTALSSSSVSSHGTVTAKSTLTTVPAKSTATTKSSSLPTRSTVTNTRKTKTPKTKKSKTKKTHTKKPQTKKTKSKKSHQSPGLQA